MVIRILYVMGCEERMKNTRSRLYTGRQPFTPFLLFWQQQAR